MSQQYQLTGQLHELASARQGEILFFRAPELPSGLYTVAVRFDGKTAVRTVAVANR